MRVCCLTGVEFSEMSAEDKEFCNNSWCDGSIETEYSDGEGIDLLTTCGTFDTNDCISVEDLWKIVEQEKEI